MSEHSSPGNEHWLELANELEREHNIYLSQYGSFACKETRAKLEQRLWDDKQTFIQALRAPAQAKPDRLAVAMEIWHRFAPEHVIEWEDETHQAEYLFCADAILALPSTGLCTLEGNGK